MKVQGVEQVAIRLLDGHAKGKGNAGNGDFIVAVDFLGWPPPDRLAVLETPDGVMGAVDAGDYDWGEGVYIYHKVSESKLGDVAIDSRFLIRGVQYSINNEGVE